MKLGEARHLAFWGLEVEPWVSFCLTVLPDRRLSSLKGESCFCPEAQGAPECCRVRAVSRHPRAKDWILDPYQIQALTLGPQGEAGGLGGEEDRRGTGNGAGMDDHVELCSSLSLGPHQNLLEFAVEVF